MILYFQTDLKGYREKISNNYINFQVTCPKCGAIASMHRHSFYERHVTYIEDGVVCDTLLSVLRLQCNSCGSTHAILPSNVIPYCIYSLDLIFQITAEVLLEDHSVIHTSTKYGLSHQLVYLFINRLLDFQNDTILVLRILEHYDLLTLKGVLQTILSILSFPKDYFTHTRWSFLMQKFRNTTAIPIFLGSD